MDTLQHDVFDETSTALAIVNCAYAVESIHNRDAASAIASATNDWLIDDWLERDTRLYASIVVPSQEPELAAREIARVGSHPRFVQVFLPVHSRAPYGRAEFHPIFAEAVRHDLVVALQFGGAPGNPPTGTGWPSYYVEEYTGMAAVFQTQLMSLIVEGVFDKFPALRVALVEGGSSWLPPFLWRFDKEWKGLRRETPWTKKLPSLYVRDHVKATLRPFDGPFDGKTVMRILEQLECEEFLMYSTDYPHWHGEDGDPIPRDLPHGVLQNILSGNARNFYRIG